MFYLKKFDCKYTFPIYWLQINQKSVVTIQNWFSLTKLRNRLTCVNKQRNRLVYFSFELNEIWWFYKFFRLIWSQTELVVWFQIIKNRYKINHISLTQEKNLYLTRHWAYLSHTQRNLFWILLNQTKFRMALFLINDMQIPIPQKWPNWVFYPKRCAMFWNICKNNFLV